MVKILLNGKCLRFALLISHLLIFCASSSYVEEQKLKTFYNQAYADNVLTDEITEIIQQARNAYILVDPYKENVVGNIPALKANNNEVGCYISIGTGEDWRDDFASLKPYLVSQQWPEWPGEYFVKEAATGVLNIMKKRIDTLKTFGCDWVEFDNMDWAMDDEAVEKYGIDFSQEESIAYYQTLCQHAHSNGIKCMAKNTVDDAEMFDGVLYESYRDEKNWWDQKGTQSFLNAGKLVIINHYDEKYPDKIYNEYMEQYHNNIVFIAESTARNNYIHYP